MQLTALLLPFREFLFPPLCSSCRRLLDNYQTRICSVCWETIRPITPMDTLYRETRAKLQATSMVDDLIACFSFDEEGALPTVIHQLKYTGASAIGIELGRRLGAVLESSAIDTENSVMVPVPLHKVKLRERGYNQSEFIGKGISEIVQIPVVAILVRTRYTKTQTQLSRDDRKANVAGAFSRRNGIDIDFSTKTFLLIDDVITTGATTVECAAVLRSLGATRIIACAIALAP